MPKFIILVTDKMIHSKTISAEKRELYEYGMWQGLLYVLNIGMVILVSLILQMLWQGILFTLAYGVLRIYAGGYHARTQKACFSLSLLLIISVISILRWITFSPVAITLFVIISTGCIFALAPIADSNKPLSNSEYVIYRLRSRVICAIYIVLIMVALYFGRLELAICLMLSTATVAFMVILGKCIE